MDVKCYETNSKGLLNKGVARVIDCPVKEISARSIPEVRDLVLALTKRIIPGLESKIEYESSETIGYTHTLHRFRAFIDENKYVGIRAVLRSTSVIRLILTIPEKLELSLVAPLENYNPEHELGKEKTLARFSNVSPPGQVYVDIPIVYAIMGVPRIDLSRWILEVNGEVEKPIRFSINDLYEMGVTEVNTSFHCVTGWSVGELSFTGVPTSRIVEYVKPHETVKWVYVESLDGYSTVIPYKDFMSNKALIALEMNGKPLDILHGYPARLVIPHLYGWKSAKWLCKIVFARGYKDGYWEALGYHPRGNVILEERFKES